MKSFMKASVFLAALYANSANAFFRMGCDVPTVVERADPIVNPGAVSGHLHQVLGGNAFNFSMTYDTARSSSCSTCQAVADLSNYWTPTLFLHNKDGTFTSVPQVGGGTVYYLQRYSFTGQRLQAFPEGFRMLAGNPMLRSFNASSLEQQAVSFVCLDYNGSGAGGQWNYLPQHNCPDGVRMQVFFPSCWDGKNVDSSDHKSHMAYPDGMDNGVCPDSHPVRLISIFYEITFDTNSMKDSWWTPPGASQPFVISTGDPTGYSFHGDFLNGWDVPTLQNAVDNCTNLSGLMTDCPVLTLRTDQVMNDCVKPPSVPEITSGTIPALPGCNPVQNGPANAVPPSTCSATKEIVPGSYLKAETGWTALGCARDDGAQRVLPNRWAPGNMTVELCLAHCKSTGMDYAGLEWAQECWCGSTMDKSTLGDYNCATPCQGNANEYCGGTARLAVYQLGGSAPAPSSSSVKPTTTTPKPSSTTSAKPVTSSKASTTTAKPVTTAKPATTVKPTSSSVHVTTTTPKPSSSTKKATSTSAKFTTSAAKPAATTPPASPNKDWESLGCYVDPVNPRALRGTERWVGKPMTPEVCIEHCSSKGMEFAGVEYGKECFCGNELHGSVKVHQTECFMECTGDKKEICGSGYHLSLYKKKPAPPKPAVKLPSLKNHRSLARRFHINRLVLESNEA